MIEFEEYKEHIGIDSDCNFCGKSERSKWGQRGIFKLDQCDHCGLVYINPRLSDQGLQKLYANYLKKREQAAELSEKRLKMYRLEADFILKHMYKQKSILDVGCGGGDFLGVFPDKYAKFATDYDSAAVKEASKKGIKCYEGDLIDIRIEEAPFDLIMFRGVLEHVTDPKGTLHKVSSMLTPGGLLYITSTPNLNSICAELFRGMWNLVGPDHLFYFNESLLSNLLSSLGFILIDQHHFYEETPYANLKEDFQKILIRIDEIRNGMEAKNLSPPYWGNMLSLVYQKQS